MRMSEILQTRTLKCVTSLQKATMIVLDSVAVVLVSKESMVLFSDR